jgi:hypothetical protein
MVKSGLFAFEVPITVTRLGSGQLVTRTRDGLEPTSVVFDVSEQIAVRIDSDRRHAKLNDGSRSTLRIKLPSLFRPFEAPLLLLDSKKSVYYSPKFEGGSGLAPSSRQALIIHSPSSNGTSCDAMVTLLIPNTGVGRDQIVRDLLGSKLANTIKAAVNDPDWFESSVSQPSGGVSVDGPSSGPTGQQMPPGAGPGPMPPMPGSN